MSVRRPTVDRSSSSSQTMGPHGSSDDGPAAQAARHPASRRKSGHSRHPAYPIAAESDGTTRSQTQWSTPPIASERGKDRLDGQRQPTPAPAEANSNAREASRAAARVRAQAQVRRL